MKKRIIVKYIDKNEDKRVYLQLLQEPICRMSTISAIFKGFAATIVAGISVISYSAVNKWVLVLSFIPVFVFMVLDIYYLRMERKFKYLYNQVRTEERPIDFSITLTKDPIEVIAARARVFDCLKSPSIYLFYPTLLIILIVVIALELGGVI